MRVDVGACVDHRLTQLIRSGITGRHIARRVRDSVGNVNVDAGPRIHEQSALVETTRTRGRDQRDQHKPQASGTLKARSAQLINDSEVAARLLQH